MRTTNEVLAMTGLSYPQLNRLKDLGIVPKPKLMSRGRRKGVTGVFEDDVIEVINWVKQQQRLGVPLTQMAEMRRKELADVEVVEPIEEYFIPMMSSPLQSYADGHGDFHEWLQRQIAGQWPGYEVHKIEMELVNQDGRVLLKPKGIKVRPGSSGTQNAGGGG